MGNDWSGFKRFYVKNYLWKTVNKKKQPQKKPSPQVSKKQEQKEEEIPVEVAEVIKLPKEKQNCH